VAADAGSLRAVVGEDPWSLSLLSKGKAVRGRLRSIENDGVWLGFQAPDRCTSLTVRACA
jgi:hypothetical protein